MAFFAQKLMVFRFLLAIVLLTCISYANANFRQVSEKDRKLIGIFTVGVAKGTAKAASKGAGKAATEITEQGTAAKSRIDLLQFTENVVIRRLQKDQRSLRFGWKTGKRLYSIERSCEKVLSISCSPTSSDCSAPQYCLVEFAVNTKRIYSCNDTCVMPPQTPCIYSPSSHSQTIDPTCWSN